MKNFLAVMMATFFFSTACAQLKNTRWKATLEMNGPVNTMFDFRKDTALVYTVADSTMIERMTYSSTDTSFTMMKIDGQSECDNIPGSYLFTIKEDKLTIKVLKDECYDRSNIIDNSVWTKWKDPE